MKTSQIFWGLFFLSLGSLFFLDKYEYIDFSFLNLSTFWPFILVIIGLIIIFRESKLKPVLSGIGGLFLALIIYGFFNGLFSFFYDDNDYDLDFNNYQNEKYYEAYDTLITSAKLTIAGGMGKFTIHDSTDDLIKAKSSSAIGNFYFDVVKRSDDFADINLEQSNSNVKIRGLKKMKNRLDVELNPNPIWEINLKSGASDCYLDLEKFKVKTIDIETGASNTKIKLSDLLDETNINVDMGVASFELSLPENVGCELNGDMGLVSKSLKDFYKEGNKYYSNNYSQTTKKVYLNVNGGLSSIKIKRY